MSYVEEDSYQAGYDYGVSVERARTRELRFNMGYLLGVAIDYIETIQQVSTEGIVAKFKQFREEVARDGL